MTTDTIDDTDISDEVRAAREAHLAAANKAGGGRVTSSPRADYFGSATWQHVLSDGTSFIEHKKLKEGDLQKYRNGSNRDVTINRGTKDAKIRMAAGDDRALLLNIAVCGWDLHRDGQPVAYSEKSRDKVLADLDPDLVNGLVKDIYAKNPSLRAEVTAQDIRDEIASLQIDLEEKEKEEAGEASSSS